ncbi:MAG: outer membrane beta-barrel protein [Ferruginibacter sp.]|nr:outer membrane beta-barrel protein [Cytophagales bacterium]
MSTRDDDNELDKAFRKALEHPDIPFDSRAWQAMNRKLDDFQARRAARRKRWLATLTALLLLTASGTWYSTQRPRATGADRPDGRVERRNSPVTANPRPTARESTDRSDSSPATGRSGGQTVWATPFEKAVKDASSKNQTSTDAPIARREQGMDEAAALPITPPPARDRPTRNATPATGTPGQPSGGPGVPGRKSTEPENKVADRLRPERAPGRKPNKKAAPAPGTPTNAPRRPPVGPVAGRLRDRLRDETPAGQREGLPDGALSRLRSVPPGYPLETLSRLRPVPPRFLLAPANGKYLVQLLSQRSDVEIQPDLSQEIAKPRTKSLLSRLSFLLTVAPDLSTVGFVRFTAPGISGGVALEYRLSDRWSVTAGGFYSDKRYQATADDYTPSRPWTYRPDLIGGNCKIIDLPVNLRYYALSRATGNLFVGVGLSSYLMRSEDYEYRYNHYPTRTWKAPDRVQHWLGVINLSMGYEWKLGNRFAIQVEPYLKLPITGVGAGDVKLSSTGAFMTLKYRMSGQ